MRRSERCGCPICRALDLMFPAEGEQLALWPTHNSHSPKEPTPSLAGHFVRRGR